MLFCVSHAVYSTRALTTGIGPLFPAFVTKVDRSIPGPLRVLRADRYLTSSVAYCKAAHLYCVYCILRELQRHSTICLVVFTVRDTCQFIKRKRLSLAIMPSRPTVCWGIISKSPSAQVQNSKHSRLRSSGHC